MIDNGSDVGSFSIDDSMNVDNDIIDLTVVTDISAVTDSDETPVISVVMPCLNEQDSVALCVERALAGIRASGLTGEVVVADNGSTDDSVRVAQASGAIVVHETRRGYGSAYLCGFAAARGRIVVMGDSDGSYDFAGIPALIEPLVQGGVDYVLGSRFGGTIQPGAMVWSHRYVGNPLLTTMLNLLFGLDVSDAHSGLRAFTRPALDRMALRCDGMEFASEIVIKAARCDLRVAEVPIVYHPRIGESKLHAVRDGWRHLRFLLTLSPSLLSLRPGALLLAGGVAAEIGLAFGAGTTTILSAKIICAVLAVLGGVLVTGGMFAGLYAFRVGFDRRSRAGHWADTRFRLERALLLGLVVIVAGFAVTARELMRGYLALDRDPVSVSMLILGVLGVIVGLQVCVGAFVLNLFQLLRLAPTGPMPIVSVAPLPGPAGADVHLGLVSEGMVAEDAS